MPDNDGPDDKKNESNMLPEPPMTNEPKPVGEDHKPRNQQNKWHSVFTKSVIDDSKIKPWIEAGLDTVALAVAAIYWGQLQAMSGQLQEMQSSAAQTDLLIINAANQVKETRALAITAGNEAKSANRVAETAAKSMVLSERPWVKIKTRIVDPLTFNQTPGTGPSTIGYTFNQFAIKSPVARMVVEDTLENVGNTVALHVVYWEDVLPIDSDHSLSTAKLRQKEWCDDNRHSSGQLGDILFPNDPLVKTSTVGPTMETVMKAASSSPKGLEGEVGFVLAGCVSYRSSFEAATAPSHETKFIYYLGVTGQSVGFNPYVFPSGVASNLKIIPMPENLSAD